MKTSGIIRNIDELGRIVVPKEMRKQMDIACGDPVEISAEGGRIILKKYTTACIFCQGTEDVIEFKNKKLCKNCILEITSDNR